MKMRGMTLAAAGGLGHLVARRETTSLASACSRPDLTGGTGARLSRNTRNREAHDEFLFRCLRKRTDGSAHLHFVGVAPGDLGVGEEIAAAHRGVYPRLVFS
jgi:hypothetical protein